MVVAAAAGIPVKVEVDAAWCIHKALRPRGSRLAVAWQGSVWQNAGSHKLRSICGVAPMRSQRMVAEKNFASASPTCQPRVSLRVRAQQPLRPRSSLAHEAAQ